MNTDLFDRYVHEVGRRLPKRQRADVETELHSLLMDALQDRAPEAEGVSSEEDQVAILKEFGPPAEVAAQYTQPHRYVVGPRLYNVYWIVVAAVGGSLTLAHAVVLLLALWGARETAGVLGMVGEVLESYLSALLAGLGSITLVFFGLERVLPDSAMAELSEKEPWDPRTLPQIEERGRLEVGGLIAEIVFTVVALVVFNVFPEWVGFNFRASINDAPARWISIPMLAPVFFTLYLPLLNVQWVARILLDVVLLRQGRWQRLTRLADFLLTAFGGYILYRMVFGPPLLTMDAISSASLRETLSKILPPLLKVALGIGLVATAVESVQKLVRVFGTETTSVYKRLTGKVAGQ
jgi:hypothetical protein